MKKSFEQNLRMQNEIAKGNTPDYTEELGDLIEKISLSSPKENKGEKEIFLLQLEKQKIMEELKEQLSCLDNPNCIIEKKYEGDIEAKYDEESGLFRVEGSDNLFSFGDLIADLNWGHYYFFQKENIDRNLHKRYLVECAKRELMDLLNLQIVESELIENRPKISQKNTYLRIRRHLRSGIDKNEGLLGGLSYEKMVISLLKKIQYDFSIDFEVVEVDKYDDVEHKTDFIIRFKEAGINIGVQFSTETNEERMETKRKKVKSINKKINKLDNLKLDQVINVFINKENFAGAFGRWVEAGRPSGGPIYYLTKEETNDILYQLLSPLSEMKLIDSGIWGIE